MVGCPNHFKAMEKIDLRSIKIQAFMGVVIGLLAAGFAACPGIAGEASNMGISLKQFTDRFNQRVAGQSQCLRIRGANESANPQAGFIHSFSERTSLTISLDGKNLVETVELDGTAKEGANFWILSDGLLATLDASLTKTGREALLRKLGKRGGNIIAKQKAEVIEHGLYYFYLWNEYDNACALLIQRAQ